MSAPILHYQRTGTSTYCGRSLPVLAYTADRLHFISTTKGRCLACRKAMAVRGLVTTPLPAPVSATPLE